MDLIFMGTPDFAVPSLERLLSDGHNVRLVVTQPDKPVGRKRVMTPPAVKACALSHNLPVYQPESMRTDETIAHLEQVEADAIIVVAYGKILPRRILDMTSLGCINVHGSLLPRYRGAAPVQWAVINGDAESGVTTMRLDEGVDTGDVLLMSRRPIDDNMTGGELFSLLAEDGAQLLSETLRRLQEGSLTATPQPTEGACYACMLDKSMCPIDWNKEAKVIHNQVRGMNPWPVATCSVPDKGTMKIYSTHVGEAVNAVPGTVVCSQPLTVACGNGTSLVIEELQAEGARRMMASDYLCGHPIPIGTVLA
ncbi:MAG: methionyl-tRNA formyltransferase [Ruminococcaceae bacterium]|nr:methionyl-tRNA formyltransferase [Oscillospiraceae bacterium]